MPVVQRALLHSLQMAQEDIAKWCRGLDDRELHARPFQLPSVAFQLRHIARSLDRFCSYAEGTPLSAEQFAALASEMEAREPASPSSANWKRAWRTRAGV